MTVAATLLEELELLHLALLAAKEALDILLATFSSVYDARELGSKGFVRVLCMAVCGELVEGHAIDGEVAIVFAAKPDTEVVEHLCVNTVRVGRVERAQRRREERSQGSHRPCTSASLLSIAIAIELRLRLGLVGLRRG